MTGGAPSRWLKACWPRTLKHQLVAMVSAVLLLALGALGGYTAHEQSDIARASVDDQVTSLAHSVAVASANLILTDSLDGLEELAMRSANFSELRALQVCDLKGQVLTHVRHAPGQPVRLVFDQASSVCNDALRSGAAALVHGEHVLVVWQPVRAELLVGWVRLEYDLSSLQRTRERIWRNTAVVTVLAVSLSALALLAFLDKPMHSLNRARLFAKQLVDASGRQMPQEPGPQEVEELTRALNDASMLLRQQMILLDNNVRNLQANEALLAEQNEQLSAIFAMSPDGLVTFSREDRVQFANQAFLDLTGLSLTQVTGQSLATVDALLRGMAVASRDFSGLDACFDAQANQVSAPVVLEVAGERRRVLALKGQRSQGVSVGRVLYVLDMTRQHLLDEMKSEFLSMAAHELRTPMVSIFGFTELMLKREMSPEQRQDLLGRIYRHSQSMVAILNELLDLARIESRRGQDFVLADLDLSVLVQSVVTDYQTPEGRQPPWVHPADGPMPVRVDAHKMQQAVLNILSNAYKYSPEGGEVEVGFERLTEDGRERVGGRDHPRPRHGPQPRPTGPHGRALLSGRQIRQHPRHRPGREHRQRADGTDGRPHADHQRIGQGHHRHVVAVRVVAKVRPAGRLTPRPTALRPGPSWRQRLRRTARPARRFAASPRPWPARRGWFAGLRRPPRASFAPRGPASR